MADFSGAFADLIPQGAAPAAVAPAGNQFASAFADLIPAKAATPGLLDRVGQFAGGVVKSLANTASTGGQAAQIEMGQPVDVPDTQATQAALEQNITGPPPVPAKDDRIGRALATTGEFVGNPASYIGPGSIAAKVGMAVLGGLGSEGAGQLAEGTPYEGAARFVGAVLGGATAAKLAQPGAVEAVIGKAPSAAAPTPAELKAAYTAVRNSPEVKTAAVPIQDVKNLAATAEADLLSQGFRPTTASAPATFSELNRITPQLPPELTPLQKLQAEMNWESLPQNPQVTQATVDDLLAARRAFGQTAKQKNPFPIGGSTPDAVASQQTIRKLDDLIEQHAPEMREANANYSAAKTAEALDNRIAKAEDQAAAANSGLNIGNKLRQQAVNLLHNPAAMRGLRPDEIQMLEGLARGTPTRNAVRWFSNVLGGGGGLGALVTGEVGSHAGLGVLGFLAAPIGHVLKHIENHLTVKAANQISEAIRSRSPLGQAIQSSAEKWNAARDALVKGPNSAKFAAFSIASRNLSNNLAGAGVNVHPIQLLRSVQGPSSANAQDEQQ